MRHGEFNQEIPQRRRIENARVKDDGEPRHGAAGPVSSPSSMLAPGPPVQ
jgi:hypothetical protein